MNSVTSTTVSWQGNILSCVCLSLTSHFFNHLIAVTIFHFIIHFCCISFIYQLWWSRGSMLAFGTEVRGFKPGWSRRIFKGEKILSTPSFGGEVKPSVPRRGFAACKRSLELRGSRILDEICQNISRPWRLKAGESNGNLPLRTCPGCSVPEPYRSPDWVLVPAKPA